MNLEQAFQELTYHDEQCTYLQQCCNLGEAAKVIRTEMERLEQITLDQQDRMKVLERKNDELATTNIRLNKRLSKIEWRHDSGCEARRGDGTHLCYCEMRFHREQERKLRDAQAQVKP